MEMSGACNVDQKTVRRIDGNERAVAPQRPSREIVQRLCVTLRIGRLNHKARHARLRLCQGETGMDAQFARTTIGGGHHQPLTVTDAEH